MNGEFCVVYANLKPRPLKVAGIDSHGMLLFAASEDRSHMEFVRPPAGSKVGERLALANDAIPDFSQDFQAQLNPKKKVLEGTLPFLKSNDNCDACFDGIPLKTSGGIVKVATLKQSMIS